MRFLVNGQEGGQVTLQAGGDSPLLNLQVLNDNGSPFDVTGLAAKLEIYARRDRTDTPVEVTLTPDGTLPTAGVLTAQKILAATTTQLAVGTHYGFVKIGAAPIFGNLPVLFVVG